MFPMFLLKSKEARNIEFWCRCISSRSTSQWMFKNNRKIILYRQMSPLNQIIKSFGQFRALKQKVSSSRSNMVGQKADYNTMLTFVFFPIFSTRTRWNIGRSNMYIWHLWLNFQSSCVATFGNPTSLEPQTCEQRLKFLMLVLSTTLPWNLIDISRLAPKHTKTPKKFARCTWLDEILPILVQWRPVCFHRWPKASTFAGLSAARTDNDPIVEMSNLCIL